MRAQDKTRARFHPSRRRVIRIVEAFQHAEAKPVLTHMSLEVGGRRFGWYMENHHGDGRIRIDCVGAPGKSHMLAKKNPTVYHIPSYAGKRGWIGMFLDVPGIDWKEIQSLLREAYSLVVPQRLLTSDHETARPKRRPKRKSMPTNSSES